MALHGAPVILQIFFMGKIFLIPLFRIFVLPFWNITVKIFKGEINWRNWQEIVNEFEYQSWSDLGVACLTFTAIIFVLTPHGLRITSSAICKMFGMQTFKLWEPAYYFEVEQLHELALERIKSTTFKECWREIALDSWVWVELSWKLRTKGALCKKDAVIRKEHKSKTLNLIQKIFRCVGNVAKKVENKLARILREGFQNLDLGITSNKVVFFVFLLFMSPFWLPEIFILVCAFIARFVNFSLANWLEPKERLKICYDGIKSSCMAQPPNLVNETLRIDYPGTPHFLEVVLRDGNDTPMIIKKVVDPSSKHGVRVLPGAPQKLQINAAPVPSLEERREILDALIEEESWVRRNRKKSIAIFLVAAPTLAYIGHLVIHSIFH